MSFIEERSRFVQAKFVPAVGLFSIHALWNSSLYTWIIYLHQLGTRVSKAQDANLLKCFENMPTNEIVANIMIKWQICSILER